ncbi:MAG: hypothetical protein L3J82_07075 [Planctomycetes bacterium]|nr:hypothetical protein [Planctomycetota bacterium]
MTGHAQNTRSNTRSNVPYGSPLPENSELRPKPALVNSGAGFAPHGFARRSAELSKIANLESGAYWMALIGLLTTVSLCGAIGLITGPLALLRARRADTARMIHQGEKGSQGCTRVMAWLSLLLPAGFMLLVSLLVLAG